jgi:NAD(P)-dependent dehydrogenase (short-subunit alcohol dehydrogenase family)
MSAYSVRPVAILRDGLLAGQAVALGAGVRAPVRDLLLSLGATVHEPQAAAAAHVRALVHHAGATFGAGGEQGLLDALEQAWSDVAAVANEALIGSSQGGKIVLIAPRAGAGDHADAARDGLENLARTLSVEWARYGITTTAIVPAAAACEQDVALLVAFLLSPAGDYFSGCRLEIGAAG